MYTGPSGSPLLPDDFKDTIPSPDSPATHDSPAESDNINHEGNDNSDGSNDNNIGSNQNDDNPYQQNGNSNEGNWTSAKNLMSRYSSGSSNNYKKVVSNYVKAHGGSKNAARSASSGIRSTSGLGQFLFSSSSQGIRETLSQYKIEYEGKTAKDILTEIINRIAPIPITKEDSVARKALIRTMEVLYEKIDDEKNDITTLEKIDKELLNEIIPIQVESYIYERIINDLGSRIESNTSSPADAVSKEKELKEYINSKVETTLKGTDFSQMDFNKNVSSEIENLYKQCYKVMEDIL